MYFPSVIETTGRNSKAFDLPTKLLQDRIVYLSGPIDSLSSDSVIMQLLWLNSEDDEAPINLYIKSPGGSVYDGLAIKDVIDRINAPVNTIAMGMVASMGAYLVSAGTGVRKAMPNARIMIHSVSSGTSGNFHDMEVDFEQTKKLQDQMMSDIAKFSKGKSSVEEIRDKCRRDFYMVGDEAIQAGLIDEIIG